MLSESSTLTKKLSRNTAIAFLSCFFFITASGYFEVFSWPPATIQVTFGTSLAFFAVFLYLRFLSEHSLRTFLFSFLFAYASFLTKDQSIYLFFLMPILFLIAVKKNKWPDFIVWHWPIALFLCVIFFFRSGSLVLEATTVIQPITSPYILSIAKNSILYPFMSLSHAFLYQGYHNVISSTFHIDKDVISSVFSLLILCWFVICFCKNPKCRMVYAVSFLGYITSFLAISIYLPHYGTSGHIQSRYLYQSIMWISIAFGTSAYMTITRSFPELKKFQFREWRITKWRIWVVIILTILYLLSQAKATMHEITRYVVYGHEMKSYLIQLKQLYPQLPDKPVFFVSGDRDYFYPNNKIPFMLGPGYVFMVWYADSGKIPIEFIEEKFLIDDKQGYKELGNKGFGFFKNEAMLKEAIVTYNISSSQIIAVYWDSTSKKLSPLRAGFLRGRTMVALHNPQ